MRYNNVFLDSIEASIPACHAGDPGSIPGRGVNLVVLFCCLFSKNFYFLEIKIIILFLYFLFQIKKIKNK